MKVTDILTAATVALAVLAAVDTAMAQDAGSSAPAATSVEVTCRSESRAPNLS